MMFSRPIVSGAMLVLLIAVVGGAAWQGRDEIPDARIADVADPAPASAYEVVEQPATAPERVVDAAGFPAVAATQDAENETQEPSPIVTINGRPLGAEEASESTIPAPDKLDEAIPDNGIAQSEVKTEVAVAAPPLPKPRPEGLAVRTAAPAIDYDAIAEAAYGGETGDYLIAPPEPDVLAPMAGVYDYDRTEGAVPHDDELVGVVGPNGEVIWVYEEQVPALNSRVTVQRQQPANPFGFIYE